jgi:transcriptional regulator with GAF, ATPase, and Fis domain
MSEIFGHVKGSFTGADRTVAGALAEANGGTVFFDEIGNLPLGIQPKLLRVLQDRKYVQLGTTIEKEFVGKFIFATNKNLDRMVEEGLFMPDLYDRFNVFKISIPPLRSRKEDIPLLAEHFVRGYGDKHGKDFGNLKVTKDCIKYLKSLDWKGNIRTLENAVKDIVARRIGAQDRSEITVGDLPAFITTSEGPRLYKLKKKLPGNTRITDEDLIECLNASGNNKTRAAEMLGVDPCTIHRRWKKLSPQS